MLKRVVRRSGSCLFAMTLLAVSPGWAQGARGVDSTAPSLAEQAKGRFPQPVRVGDLVDRQVLEPSNKQGVLGRVDGVARTQDGQLELVVRYGGVLGYFTRPIAVPVAATTLLGPFVQIVDIPEATLKTLPDFTGAGTTRLRPDETIRVGINRN